MKCNENPTEARRRISRLNRYIVVLALLWIATGVALLLVADTAHARVACYKSSRGEHAAVLSNRPTTRDAAGIKQLAINDLPLFLTS